MSIRRVVLPRLCFRRVDFERKLVLRVEVILLFNLVLRVGLLLEVMVFLVMCLDLAIPGTIL